MRYISLPLVVVMSASLTLAGEPAKPGTNQSIFPDIMRWVWQGYEPKE